MLGTITLRNHRSEYLFISKYYFDDEYTHVTLTSRSGRIIRSYELPISLKVCQRAMEKAGWKKADF